MNGTTKLRHILTAVVPPAWPFTMTSPSLMIDKMQPTIAAIVSVRLRLEGAEHVSRAARSSIRETIRRRPNPAK